MLVARDLHSIRLLAGLSESDLDRVASGAREVLHPKGTLISVRGEQGIGFAMILAGEAEVATPDGGRRKLGPGDCFGEMALLDREGRSADVIAISDVRCAAVPEWAFEDFLIQHPPVMLRLLRAMSRRVREAEAR